MKSVGPTTTPHPQRPHHDTTPRSPSAPPATLVTRRRDQLDSERRRRLIDPRPPQRQLPPPVIIDHRRRHQHLEVRRAVIRPSRINRVNDPRRRRRPRRHRRHRHHTLGTRRLVNTRIDQRRREAIHLIERDDQLGRRIGQLRPGAKRPPLDPGGIQRRRDRPD